MESLTYIHYPPVIGLWAPAMRSGKSTVAAHLEFEHGYTLVSFAAPLKHMVFALLCASGMSKEEAEGRVWGGRKEEPIPQLQGRTARFLMQTLGTEWGRETVYQNLWADSAAAQADAIIASGGRVVIDDMRFPNEVEVVRREGGVTVNVVRPSTPITERHGSEGALANHPFDFTLRNDGAIEDLHHRVDVWMSSFQRRIA